jgi:hypothetical protein
MLTLKYTSDKKKEGSPEIEVSWLTKYRFLKQILPFQIGINADIEYLLEQLNQVIPNQKKPNSF